MRVVDFRDDVEVAERRLADLPDRVVEGDPRHQTQLRFSSPDGELIAGTWTSTPGKWIAFADRDEFSFVLVTAAIATALIVFKSLGYAQSLQWIPGIPLPASMTGQQASAPRQRPQQQQRRLRWLCGA